jgi:hypothetical protein
MPCAVGPGEKKPRLPGWAVDLALPFRVRQGNDLLLRFWIDGVYLALQLDGFAQCGDDAAVGSDVVRFFDASPWRATE